MTRLPTPEELRFHCFVGKNIHPTFPFLQLALRRIFPPDHPMRSAILNNFGAFRFTDQSFYSDVPKLCAHLRCDLIYMPSRSPLPLLHYIECPEIGLYTTDHGDLIDRFRSIREELDPSCYLWVFTDQPLIVNEFLGNETTLITGPWDDPSFHLFSSLPGYERGQKVYALGEWWLSYSDGTQEEKNLLQGLPRPCLSER